MINKNIKKNDLLPKGLQVVVLIKRVSKEFQLNTAREVFVVAGCIYEAVC